MHLSLQKEYQRHTWIGILQGSSQEQGIGREILAQYAYQWKEEEIEAFFLVSAGYAIVDPKTTKALWSEEFRTQEANKELVRFWVSTAIRLSW